MENSCLFTLGSLRGIRTAAIGTIDGSPFTWDTEGYDPQGTVVSDGKKKMLQVGLMVCKQAMDEINHDQAAHAEKLAAQEQFFSSERTKEIIKTFQDEELQHHLTHNSSLPQQAKEKVKEFAEYGLMSEL